MTKNNKSKKGFTIVELLVVIVVIGILSAISIVSYSSLTKRAKIANTITNAKNIISVANAYNADKGVYPALGSLNSGSYATISSNITIGGTNPTEINGEKTFKYETCGTPVVTGAKVTYFDYEANAATGIIKTGTGCL